MGKESNIKLSVIIPTYNRRETILRSARSVSAQLRDDFELVIIDDGSTDGTMDVILKMAPQQNLIIHRFDSNKGVNAARNAGVRLANGEFVLFLDSDDYMVDKSLDKVFLILSRKDISGHLLFVCLEEGTMRPWNLVWPPDGTLIDFHRQLTREYNGDYCHVVRKEYLFRYPFFEEFKASEDLNWFRISKECSPEQFFNIPVVVSRRNSLYSLTKDLNDLSKADNIAEQFRSNSKEIELFHSDYYEHNREYLKKQLNKTILLGIAIAKYEENRLLLNMLKEISFMSYLAYSLFNYLRLHYFILYLIKIKQVIKR
ncbi:MAG: glycosyltransferase family 2 protein [Candidatus Omnitrophica bacterium]|nr:glycosyltransferase family 2 protein [Candidatus Omnitrophota bacterium]